MAGQLRRSGQVSRTWRFPGFPRGGRVPAVAPAAQRLRGPRAAWIHPNRSAGLPRPHRTACAVV